MEDRVSMESASETFSTRKDWHQPSWRAPPAVPWSMPAERTPRDAVCDWEQILKIRARWSTRLDESCNSSRVTESRGRTVRPGSGPPITYSRQPRRPRTVCLYRYHKTSLKFVELPGGGPHASHRFRRHMQNTEPYEGFVNRDLTPRPLALPPREPLK